MDENLDIFFADFAQEAQIKIGNNPFVPLLCLFDREGASLGLGAEGSSLIASVKAEDIQGAKHGDLFELDGKQFTIIGIEQSDDIAELVLKE